MQNREINIVHLYPDLLNLYGDKGNIASLEKRLKWRGIDVNIITCNKEDSIDIQSADIIFLGGGGGGEQELVCGMLREKKDELIAYAENGGVLVATCGGYQMLGKYYKTADATVEGIGILDIYTEADDNRLIGNVVLESELVSQPIIGFENHPGRTYIGEHTPLGKVVCGYGNTADSGYEGVVYKNVFATNLHGPLLPKNPMLCDLMLSRAMSHKYPDFDGFDALDDEYENQANEYMQNFLNVK